MKVFLTTVCLLNLLFVLGQNNTFYRKYNLAGMQGALQLDVTIDGGFVATGQHEGNGSHGDCDIYAYKLDVCGNVEWFKIYGTAQQEGGRSIFQMADGNYLVSGLYSGSGTYRAFNMKIDQTGNVIWIKRYNFEWMMYATEAQNGDIITYGRTAGSLYVVRTNDIGDIIWTKQITGFGDMGLWLKELPNGDIILTSVNNSIAKDVCAARLDSQGNVIWSKGYGGTGWSDVDHTTWSCKGTIDLDDNTVVITSPTLMGGLSDENILVTKLSLTDGSVVWAKVFGGAGRDQSRDITKFPGGYAILGHTNSYPIAADPAQNIFEGLSEKDVLLFTIDLNGQLMWSRTYGGADRDKGIGVKYNLDNGFSISAFTTSPYFGNVDASFDPLFIKTDSIGVVSCQMHSPQVTEVSVALVGVNAGTYQNVTLATDVPGINTTDFVPNDQYVCQSCVSIPEFSVSDTTICINDTVFFTNTTTIGLTCFQEWSIEGQQINGSIDPEWVFTQPGVYQVLLYSTCANSPDTISVNIYVYDPQISTSQPVCEFGPEVQMTATLPGGTWIGSGVTDPIQGTFSPATSGIGYVPIAYEIPELCIVYDSILVNPRPTANAGVDIQACETLQAILGTTGQPGQSYSWTPALHLSNSTISDPEFNFTNSSFTDLEVEYVLTVTIDSSGCTDTDTSVITVWALPPVSAGPNVQYCEFEQIVLNATGASTYSWSPVITNGVSFTQDVGTQTYSVIGTDENGCLNSDDVEVTVFPLPVVFGYPDTAVCENEWVTLYGGGAASYEWTNGVVNGIPFQQGVGNQVYTVLGTDVNGCVNSATVEVTVWPNPNANFSISEQDLMVNFLNQSLGAVDYTWDFGDGSPLSHDENVQHFYAELNGQSYTVILIAESEFGCLDTATRYILSPEPILLYVPNTFTPDYDEFNNNFGPVFYQGFDPYDFTMTIFNRWGEIIFVTHDATIGWDGTYNGKFVQQGTYTWVIEFKTKKNDERKRLSGHVNMIK
jgi:gliding motility-associated-like protein